MMKKNKDETLRLVSRLYGRDGYLGRQVVGKYFAFTNVRLEKVENDDALVYETPYDAVPGRWIEANQGALDDFIRLAWPEAGTRRHGGDVLTFVKRWGVLELCEHKLPFTHAMGDLLMVSPPVNRHEGPSRLLSGRFCQPLRYYIAHQLETHECIELETDGVEPAGCIEYVQTWRFFAESAVLLLELAASLRARSDPSNEESTRKKLVSRLNKWLDMANVGVSCRDTGKGEWPSGMQIEYINRGGLFGVLSVQLLLATTLNEFLFTCAECGKSFNPAPARGHARGSAPSASGAAGRLRCDMHHGPTGHARRMRSSGVRFWFVP
jgi:hypothetical protein